MPSNALLRVFTLCSSNAVPENSCVIDGRLRCTPPLRCGEASPQTGRFPTLPRNGAATVSAPSTIFNGRIGNGRGAGPKTTAADFRGSYSEAWQKQCSVCFSLFHPVTGHCSCLQMAEYATM